MIEVRYVSEDGHSLLLSEGVDGDGVTFVFVQIIQDDVEAALTVPGADFNRLVELL